MDSYDYYENGEENAMEVEVEMPPAPPLEIPIRDETRHETSEVIAFDPLDLPSADDVIEVLIDQEATQMRWLRFAAAYVRAGRAREAEKILVKLKGDYLPPSRASAPASTRKRNENEFNPDRLYSNDLEGRALVGNALAALYVHFAREHRLSARQNADKEPELDKPMPILGADGRMEQVQPQQLLARAEALLQTADKFSSTERVASLTWTTKGEIQMEQFISKVTRGGMSQTEIDKSLNTMGQTFQSALDLRPNSMRAIFGKAAILFQKGQFAEARELYSRGIARFPGADPGATRVALGLCYYELNEEGRAQECFERALELNPKCVDAHVCLAIIEMGLATDAERAAGDTAQELARNQERARRLRERANDRLRIAYDLDKWNPLLKVHLANNFFYSDARDYKRIGDLAKEAFNHSTSRQIKAEACYISARNFHAQNDTRNAATLYAKGIDHWAMFPLARYGHAQMELTQTKPDLSAALRAIQEVINSPEGKDDEDCLLMVGALHRMMHNTEAALQYLRRVTEKNPYRSEAWLQQALLEQAKYRQSLTSAEESIRCYDKAVAALRFNKEPVPYELYNNVGSLKFRVGDFKGALAAFDQAIKERGGDLYESSGKLQLNMVTLAYNRARVLESLGRIDEAEVLYNDLVKLSSFYPGEAHVDAQLRLASIAAARGDFETAIESHIKPVSTSLPKNSVSDFYCFYGDVEIARAKLAEFGSAKPFAESKFKRVLDVNTNDPYARLAVANLLLEEAQNLSQRKEDREKAEGMVREAAQYFRTILRRNPTNVFAANGLGACHATRGRFQTSQLILSKVREFADSICPSAWINLAHVQIHEGAFEQAASLYDQCLKRFYDNRDPEISLYLANARFLSGKYTEARAALLQALKFYPQDDGLWFALANVEEAEAYQRLEVDPKIRTKVSVEKAMGSLSRALNLYNWMIAKSHALSKAKAEQRSDESTSVAKRAFKEASAPLQVPHRPAPPLSAANGHQLPQPSQSLIARARVAAAEIRGQGPSPTDQAAVAKADAIRKELERKEAEKFHEMGRRRDVERAIPPNAARTLSSTAVNRLAQLAAKRAEIVQEEMKKSESYLEAQRKLERKAEADRKRLEELRLAEKKRAEEEARRIEEEKQKEQEKIAERQMLLAKANEELLQIFKESEIAEAGVRKSGRERKKTQKMLESEQTSRKGTKKKKKKVDEEEEEESSSEDEDESDEEEEEESAASSEDDASEYGENKKSKNESEEEEEGEDKKAIVKRVMETLRELVAETENSENLTTAWYKEQCKKRLGEDIVEKVSIKNLLTQILTSIMSGREEDEKKTKRLKLAPAEDEDEAKNGEEMEEVSEKEDNQPQRKPKSRRISDSDDEEEENSQSKPSGEAPNESAPVEEEEL